MQEPVNTSGWEVVTGWHWRWWGTPWDRVGAALNHGRTADGAPQPAESQAVVCTLPQMLTKLYKARYRHPGSVPPGEVSKHGEAYRQTLPCAVSRVDLVRMVRQAKPSSGSHSLGQQTSDVVAGD